VNIEVKHDLSIDRKRHVSRMLNGNGDRLLLCELGQMTHTRSITHEKATGIQLEGANPEGCSIQKNTKQKEKMKADSTDNEPVGDATWISQAQFYTGHMIGLQVFDRDFGEKRSQRNGKAGNLATTSFGNRRSGRWLVINNL
jgi:hypothetical protein